MNTMKALAIVAAAGSLALGASTGLETLMPLQTQFVVLAIMRY